MHVDKCELLKKSKNIAIIGISRYPYKTSRDIANYLVRQGYNVVGVNPNKNFTDAGGIIVYNNMVEIPHNIDIVNVFRKSADIPLIIDDVIAIMPNALWLQLGIRNDTAVKKIIEKDILVVQDSCIKVEHSLCN